jgi:uncharacterized protein YbjT (DUF2867 family)
MRSHFRCEELLRALGLPFTILRANTFMQNLLTFAPAIRQTGALAAPAQGVRLSAEISGAQDGHGG